MIWFYFLICVLLVLFFGTKLSRYGDVIAEKSGLGGVWVGLLLLAVITSLPEIITGISAVTIVGGTDGANLALGTLFGSNALNLFILAILDAASRQSPLLSVVGRGHIMCSSLSIVLIAIAGGAILLSSLAMDVSIGWLGVISIVLIIVYLAGSRRVFKKEKYEPPIKPLQYENVSSKKTYIYFAISALAIIGTGTWLAIIGNEIAILTGWGASFVGSLFLAVTTSLPELVVAYSALRIGAADMAFADIMGSNMFNMGIGIFCYDVFYTGGSIFSAASLDHVFVTGLVVLMSLLVIAGMLFRPKRKAVFGLSWYSLIIVLLYLGGAYIIFFSPWS